MRTTYLLHCKCVIAYELPPYRLERSCGVRRVGPRRRLLLYETWQTWRSLTGHVAGETPAGVHARYAWWWGCTWQLVR